MGYSITAESKKFAIVRKPGTSSMSAVPGLRGDPIFSGESMAEYTYTPTPPLLAAGPFVDVEFSISEADYVYVTGGLDDDIPQIWELVAAYISVSTGAVAGNRNFRVLYRSDTNDSINYLKTDTITASQNVAGQMGPLAFLDGLAQVRDQWYWGFSQPLILRGADDLLFFLNNAQSGDSCSCYVRLKYLNRDYGMPTPYSKGGQLWR